MHRFLTALRAVIIIENWYAAITLALILPDICGSIDDPGKSKSQKRYADWFDTYVGNRYLAKKPDGSFEYFMTGKDCYALRCALLHEGSSSVEKHNARDRVQERFILHYSKAVIMHCCKPKNHQGRLVIEIPKFCNDIIDGVVAWEKKIKLDPDHKRKEEAILNLLTLHLPDRTVGSLVFATIEDLDNL